ncbi:MAG: putative bifunctional dTDP-4-dehydrorhamnose reductase and glycosyl hydrolase family 1 [Fibrobacteres bacterium]|nr:putative bifunctional dTDP-4-dehydrorhamnose reductase and glycosyl hydrolase family 1 [Fibrobacterota bacterium]
MSPTHVPNLVNASLDLLIDGEAGIWHLTNQGEEAISRYELAVTTAKLAGLDPGLIRPIRQGSDGYLARRPPYSALTSERGNLLMPLQQALQEYIYQKQLLARV